MKNLPERFAEWMQAHLFVSKDQRILLAVSGGCDSMVMASLFYEAGYSCGMAHCNFRLRGEESDGDEKLVSEIAKQFNFPFYSKQFDTADYAGKHKISIQMAARQLRYEWFSRLLQEEGYAFTATAHHAGDVAETMLLNLTKGTGLAGMHGIRVRKDRVIRPLLFASKMDLQEYAKAKQLPWREDTSNSEIKYQRNRIRNLVLPELKSINPTVEQALLQHAGYMEDYEKLLNYFMGQAEAGFVTRNPDGSVASINLQGIQKFPSQKLVLYFLLEPLGANAAQCENMLQAKQPGAGFLLDGVRLVIDRDQLTLYYGENEYETAYLVNEPDEKLVLKSGTLHMGPPLQLEGKNYHHLPGFTDKEAAWIDNGKLNFPLQVRKWQKGDYFHPLGMKGRKLISDYFTDEKFSSAMKDEVYLLLSAGEVVWLIGNRMDDRFKLTTATTEARMIKFTAK